MTAQEKQVMLHNLQIVTGIFQEFEQVYNMVMSLPQQKRLVYNELDVPDPIKSAAGKGSSVVATVIAYVILIIPSIIVASVIATLLRLTHQAGLVALISIAINAVGAKYLGGIISRKINAGGSKIQGTINQHIRSSNQAASMHNAEVDRQMAIAQQKCNAIRQRLLQMDMSWYPRGKSVNYWCSYASSFFYEALDTGMCETIGEAVKLYREELFRDQVLANQQQQISLAYQQVILQGMTIDAIHEEGAATRETIRYEGEATRGTIQAEGAATRQTIQDVGAAAREQRERHHNDYRHWFGK